jgi:hypothetical protein
MTRLKYSVEFQIETIEKGHYADYCKERFELNKKQIKARKEIINQCSESNLNASIDENLYLVQQWENKNRNNPYFDCSRYLFKSMNNRVTRITRRMFPKDSNSRIYLLTLTFTNEVLASTNSHERRVKVSRFLKQYSSNYVANIDFGNDHVYFDKNIKKTATQREHYHVLIDKDIRKKWPFGESLSKQLFNTRIDKVRTAKYLVKLCLPALKNSKKRTRMMYSKKITLSR